MQFLKLPAMYLSLLIAACGGGAASATSSTTDVGKLQGELRMHGQHLASVTCAMGSS